MADTEKEKDSKKAPIMDVAHPGTSSPSATARPIITGSGTMLRDPMVRDDKKEPEEKDTTDAEEARAPSSSSRIIQPLQSSETDEADTEDASDTKIEPTEAKDSIATEPEKKKDNSTPETDGSAIIDAVVGQSSGNKNSTKQVVDTADDHIEELVRTKQYYVKTQHAGGSPLTLIAIIVLLLSAIAVFFYYADTQGWISLTL